MKRREVLKVAAWGSAAVLLGKRTLLAEMYYPKQVDETLFQGINRTKIPGHEQGLEMLHSPVIHVADTVKAGDIFTVEILVGQTPHPMGPTHWIEHLQLNIGNEPAGNVIFRSNGYLRAAALLTVQLEDTLKGKTVSLVAQIKCNLHGIWENYANVKVV
jgi:superoxide reductase